MNGSEERFWPTRLRWRLRGAWMWPTFIILTLVDGVIMNRLPPVRTGVDPIPGVLIATFGNLFLIGVLAPWLARRLYARNEAARDSTAPAQATLEVLADRVGTALLVAGLAGVIAAGLATRPLVVSETENTEENARAVRGWVYASGDQELIRNLETSNTIRLADGSFRNCIARDDRRRRVCLLVDPTVEPTSVKRDPSAEPNSTFK